MPAPTIDQMADAAKQAFLQLGKLPPALLIACGERSFVHLVFAELPPFVEERAHVFHDMGRDPSYPPITGALTCIYLITEAWTSENTEVASPAEDPDRGESLLIIRCSRRNQLEMRGYRILRLWDDTVDLVPDERASHPDNTFVDHMGLTAFMAGYRDSVRADPTVLNPQPIEAIAREAERRGMYVLRTTRCTDPTHHHPWNAVDDTPLPTADDFVIRFLDDHPLPRSLQVQLAGEVLNTYVGRLRKDREDRLDRLQGALNSALKDVLGVDAEEVLGIGCSAEVYLTQVRETLGIDIVPRGAW